MKWGEITGKEIAKEMKSVAKNVFKDNTPACVCVGVVGRLGGYKNQRATDGGQKQVYVGLSGETGRTLLRETLKVDRAKIISMLTTMADVQVKQYRSKKDGPAINQAEPWATHNCAESNLALYLITELGKNLRNITIASYQKVGDQVSYKPLCNNCAQWVKQNFHILQEYDAHNG